MKSTGIIRKLDAVGRIVLPIELRKSLAVDYDNAELEIFVEDGKIVMKKYQPHCIFCGEEEALISFHDKTVCKKCVELLKSEL